MPFNSGQVSFGRLKVLRPGKKTLGQNELDALAEHTLSATDIGVPREVEAGWTAGEHLYDEKFGFDKNIFDGGSLAHFALRIDTNKPPADVKKAILAQQQAILAAANPSGFLSRSQKAEAKDLAERELHEHLADGRYRKSKLVPVVWDAARGALLTAGNSNAVVERLSSMWTATFDGALAVQSAGAIAGDLLAERQRGSVLTDLRPAAFSAPPLALQNHEDADGVPVDHAVPEVPWAQASPEPLDFLGNELLLWMWFLTERAGGAVEAKLPDGEDVEIAIVLDRSVDTECAWGVTGKQTLKGNLEGISPFRLPEAGEALGTGKWPRKAGVILSDGVRQWTFTFQADRWLVSGCQLPQTEDEFEHARDLLEFRLDQTRRLDALLLALFDTYLRLRTSDAWRDLKREMRAWIEEIRPSGRAAPRPPRRERDLPPLPEPKPEAAFA